MYAGSTLVFLKKFDTIFGTHQKIDRIARRNLKILAPDMAFPSSRQILNFEGINGPDGMKRKAGGSEVPQHFYNPDNPEESDLVDTLQQHYDALVKALRENDATRASFEAAWLAHAIVDGLTPAHHFPYEEELRKLRGGLDNDSRVTLKDKIVMPGESMRDMLANNWRMWGDNGLLAAHLAFEWGVTIIAIPRRFKKSQPSLYQLSGANEQEIKEVFQEAASAIAELNLYENFCKTGWTPTLSKKIRTQLLPLIINTVTIAWYAGAQEAATA
jgi:hypothetical protein